MPRQKNTRPTSIYWLVDTRPETIAAGWLQGLPFYCGKTVRSVAKRLAGHRYASTRSPHGEVSPMMRECGVYVKAATMEVVPVDGDWITRECHWIAFLRRINPNCTNVADGGAGAAGWIPGPEMRAKVGAVSQSHWNDPEYRARQSAAHKGHKRTEDSIARGKEKMRLLWETPEYRERHRQSLLGRIPTPEHRAKASASNRGQKRSKEACAKNSAAMEVKWNNEAFRANQIAVRTGKITSEETKAKMRMSHRARIEARA
jgi:hypothetical protein